MRGVGAARRRTKDVHTARGMSRVPEWRRAWPCRGKALGAQRPRTLAGNSVTSS